MLAEDGKPFQPLVKEKKRGNLALPDEDWHTAIIGDAGQAWSILNALGRYL
jgi:hypothetical protein